MTFVALVGTVVFLLIHSWRGPEQATPRLAERAADAISPADQAVVAPPAPSVRMAELSPPLAPPQVATSPVASPATPLQVAENHGDLSPYERMALAEPVRVIPLVPPPPAGCEEIRVRLTDATDKATADRFAATLRASPNMAAASYDAAAHELIVASKPGALDAKTLAAKAAAEGLEVRGEVLNLPLTLSAHASRCGSCGYYVAQKLAAEPGVKAVEIFVPVHSQLRLLVTPGALTAAAVEKKLTQLEPDLNQPLR